MKLPGELSLLGGWFIVVGMAFLVMAVRSVSRGLRSSHWPRTGGRVVANRLAQDSDGPYSVVVTFAYEVDGEEHHGEEELEPSGFPTLANAERLRARYPVGGGVEVSHDPDRPADAALRSGVRVVDWVWLAISAGAVAIGTAMLTGAIK